MYLPLNFSGVYMKNLTKISNNISTLCKYVMNGASPEIADTWFKEDGEGLRLFYKNTEKHINTISPFIGFTLMEGLSDDDFNELNEILEKKCVYRALELIAKPVALRSHSWFTDLTKTIAPKLIKQIAKKPFKVISKFFSKRS